MESDIEAYKYLFFTEDAIQKQRDIFLFGKITKNSYKLDICSHG